MITLRLKGSLDRELIRLGLKEGDEIKAIYDPVLKVGGMHFDVLKYGYNHHCSVWPENYEIIKAE